MVDVVLVGGSGTVLGPLGDVTAVDVGRVAIVVLVAGAINGLAGFGFAVVGTTILAAAIDPATAVVFMIVPILSVNVSLLGELSPEELRTYGRRFAPLMAAALVGAVAGLAVLDLVPVAPLRVALGVVALAFVATVQRVVSLPVLARAREGCFVETPLAMVGVGGAFGFLFGGTNVGVQMIAYLRSCDLPHGAFVGVVAMVFLGLNAIRVGAAGALGLYPNPVVFLASLAAVVPAVAGVTVGRRLRDVVTERQQRALVTGLLAVIGVRLVLSGLGIW